MTPMMMRFFVLAAALAAVSMQMKVRAETPTDAGARPALCISLPR